MQYFWSKKAALTKCSRNSKIFFVLMIVLLARGSTIEILDLIDTTESRYAAIAYDMFVNGDYITPVIPRGAGHTPYLGKPAGHFWLMALSYKMFGLDEWTSRLPSFLALCIIAVTLILLGRDLGRERLGIRAALISSTSLLLFFYSGAALLDVTLGACIAIALSCAFSNLLKPSQQRGHRILFWIALSGGFLIKGPIMLVLTGLPLVSWTLYRRRFRSLFRLLTPSSLFLFLSLTAPWFLLAERENPGFLQYFFINENFLRYFIKDYGDKYGVGHVLPYGSAWVVFLLCFFPWTGILIDKVFQRDKNLKIKSKSSERFSELLYFSASWMLTPLLFFTFLRQFHPGYLVCIVPGAALFLSELLEVESGRTSIFRATSIITAGLLLGSSIVACFYGASFAVSFLGAVLGLLGLEFAYSLKIASVERLSLLTTVSYVTALIIWSPIVSERRSSEKILNCLTHYSSENVVSVSILGNRSFSAHLYSEAPEVELSKPIKLGFVNYNDLDNSKVKNLLVRQSKGEVLITNYSLRAKLAGWHWLTFGNSNYVDCENIPEAA
jgi:4-amino-4-deoxy-L-arabinose transferase-like glycosyltransferase